MGSIAFLVIATGVLAAAGFTGRLQLVQATFFALSVVVAFGPSAAVVRPGAKRRLAELLAFVVVVTIVVFGEPETRQMVAGPMLLICGFAAWAVAVRSRVGGPSAPLLTAFFGLSARLAAGPVLVTTDGLAGVTMLVAAVVIPYCAARWSASFGLVAVLATAAVPATQGPLGVWAVVVVFGLAELVRRRRRRGSGHEGENDRGLGPFAGVLPALGGFAVIGLAVAPWGGLSPADLFPSASWISWSALGVAVAVGSRIPTASAGACVALAVLLLGPARPALPELAKNLSPENLQLPLPVGDGGFYGVDLAVVKRAGVMKGATIARVHIGQRTVPVRLGATTDGPADRGSQPELQLGSRHSVQRVLRPRAPGLQVQGWDVSYSARLHVADGEQPVIRRNRKVRRGAELGVLAAGPELRQGVGHAVGGCVLVALGLVSAIQLLSGGWTRAGAWLAWWPLVTGLLLNRVSVEPLHRVGFENEILLCGLAVVTAAVVGFRRGSS